MRSRPKSPECARTRPSDRARAGSSGPAQPVLTGVAVASSVAGPASDGAASGPGVVGSDVVGSDVVGSDVVGSGVVGSEVVGSAVPGSDVVEPADGQGPAVDGAGGCVDAAAVGFLAGAGAAAFVAVRVVAAGMAAAARDAGEGTADRAPDAPPRDVAAAGVPGSGSPTGPAPDEGAVVADGPGST